jgi:hypothetical protein
MAALAGCAASCSSSSDTRAAATGSSGPKAVAPGGGILSPATAIEFSPASLVFLPGDVRTVGVQVRPPGRYTLRFSLVGDARDAFLDQSQADTEDGSATLALTAPSSAATFALRASVGAVSAALPASAGTTFTTLEVVPLYAGHRNITSWFATVQTGGGCDSHAGVPPPDGSLSAEAVAGQNPLITGVPVGTSLTATVRAGGFAGGCADLSSVAAKKTNSVSITVTDRPIQLGGVSIPVELGIDVSDVWRTAWAALGSAVANGFVNGATTDAAALLDAMASASPAASRADFAAQRRSHGWDVLLAGSLRDAMGLDGMRVLIQQWVDRALTSLATSAISGTLTSPDTPTGDATLVVKSVGGLAAADAGFDATVPVSWTSASDDRVLFGGAATFRPSELATALALRAARADFPGAKSAAAALSASISCSDVASGLAGKGGGLAYVGCDATCAASRCEQALGAMWERARRAFTDAGSLDIAASGSAVLDDQATPVGFRGTWVGATRSGVLSARLGGSATGGDVTSAR